MFEAIVTLCLELSPDLCRDVLLPGYEASDKAGCEAALAKHPPEDVKGATCQPAGPALSFQQSSPGVFIHLGKIAEPDRSNKGDVSNIAFIIGETSVAVIDSGSAAWMGESIWRAVRAETPLPISHVILTHMHPDHVFGAKVLALGGAQVVGHHALDRALAERRENYLESLANLIGPAALIGTDAAPVDVVVEQSLTLDLGGRTLRLQAWPLAHTGTDLTVLDATSGILFAGDLVFDRHSPALDGSLLGWQRVLADLGQLPAPHVMPGHGGPLLEWPEGGAPLRDYLDVLARDTRAAIAKGQRIGDAVETIAASQADDWALFDAYNPRNATVAFSELEWE